MKRQRFAICMRISSGRGKRLTVPAAHLSDSENILSGIKGIRQHILFIIGPTS